MISREKTAPVVIVLLIVAAAISWHFYVNRPYVLKSGDESLAPQIFKREILAFGGKKAYARFAVAVKNLDIQNQHGFAHFFGGALYESEGVRGISVCDSRFGFGCFHEFMGRAIADKGLAIVSELDDKCAAAIGTAGPCKHGLGHGILAQLGYTQPALLHALSICDTLPKSSDDDTRLGCKGGAYMEYNMHTIRAAEGINGSRGVENGDYFAPCNVVGKADRDDCLFWMPQWWYNSVLKEMHPGISPTDDYAAVGALCESLPSTRARACYEGIGYEASNNGVANTKTACVAAGSGLNRLYCLLYGERIAAAMKAPDRLELCEGLPQDETRLCFEQSTTIRSSIPVPSTLQ